MRAYLVSAFFLHNSMVNVIVFLHRFMLIRMTAFFLEENQISISNSTKNIIIPIFLRIFKMRSKITVNFIFAAIEKNRVTEMTLHTNF